MAFTAGKGCRVLVAENDLSAYFSNAEVDSNVAALESTTFTKNAKTFIPGLSGGKIDLTGYWDNAADSIIVAYIQTAAGQTISVAPAGLTAGSVARLVSARQIEYKESTPVGGIIAMKVGVVADGEIASGFSLHDLTAETVTVNGTTVDQVTVSTATGWVAHLHVTAAASIAGDTLIVKLQDASAANFSDGVDLAGGVFTTVLGNGGPKSFRLEGAATATVRRYVRGVATIVNGGGSHSFTFSLTFARR